MKESIGRYEIHGELGRGMMGVVYAAHDPALGRDVALKTIEVGFGVGPEERQAFERRFLTEARVAAGLSHPGIVVVHDVGQDPGTGRLFMALERLDGRPLDRALAERGPLPWREALGIVERVARALHHAHSKGVIHRDVKPANIMLLPSGEPKVMDFGIAKVETSQLTAAGQLFGTPLYMSPEQARSGRLDARSDQFALGAVLYELLTGMKAFMAESVEQIIVHVLSRDPPPLSTPGLPPSLSYVLARCLAKQPEDRYPDCGALAEDLADIQAGRSPRHRRGWSAPATAGGTIVSARPSPAAIPQGSRARVPILSYLAGAVLMIAGVAGGLWLAPRDAKPLAERPAPATTPEPVIERAPLPPPAPHAARLAINFEHSLKSGSLQVYVDDELVVEEELDSRVTKKVLKLKFRKGSHRDTIDLAPGKHEVRVRVAWEDNVKAESIWADFKPGVERRLKAELGGFAGVKKSLSLKWQ